MKIRTLVLKVFVLIVFLIPLVSLVYADPSPYPQSGPFDWVGFSVEVIASEGVAWVIGAELLWRLSNKIKHGVSRSESYKIMLLVMVVSFSIGLLFWKIFGWM
jgi:hypothetical protein